LDWGVVMNVLYISGEASSRSAMETLRSFSDLFAKGGIDWRIVLPFYRSLPGEVTDSAVLLSHFEINIAWRKQYCELYKSEFGGLCCYLIDNPYYFNRVESLGYFDDSERFAFFSKAVSEVLPSLDFEPDILHCDSWQTALVPFYLTLKPGFCANIKMLLSVFESADGGEFAYETLEDVIGASAYDRVLIDCKGNVNYYKGGLLLSDLVLVKFPETQDYLVRLWATDPCSRELDEAKRKKALGKVRLWDVRTQDLTDFYKELFDRL